MRGQPWGGMSANPQFIDTYDRDDQRHNDTWLYGEMRNIITGAQILQTSYYHNGTPVFIRKAVPDIHGGHSYSGYRIGKYEIKIGAGNALSNDFPYFRYADILMMKAECMMRLGDVAGAAEIVSQVRERAFRNTNPSLAKVTAADLLRDTKYQYGYYTIPPDHRPINTTTDAWRYPVPTINFTGTDQTPVEFGGFYDELGWEFAAEARRRTDMIRFGTFQTKTWFNHRPNTTVGAENIIIFPLGRAILNNNKNLRQNPGYPDIPR